MRNVNFSAKMVDCLELAAAAEGSGAQAVYDLLVAKYGKRKIVDRKLAELHRHGYTISPTLGGLTAKGREALDAARALQVSA